ncbi:uncharacterized protein LOC133846921 [Drosophila sulfurigaster albostrigata]|uniref:uncharacterized protein LOC133846921 n=1 Tax=Drosophila sulfurigaster albostrigata TaxID=89887 RepID=UPI002D219D88|nr:uncharacterized protein LOC133846921 [Drosophila sulfurigaster albostrigata]
MRFVFVIIMLIVQTGASMPNGFQKPTRYDNFAVYKVYVTNPQQRNIINSLLKNTDLYNLWYNGQKEIHIMVNPKELQNFIRIINREGWLTELLITNVQALIDAGNKQP